MEQARFGDLADIARRTGCAPLDGVTLDIGVSSMQLDEAARGFSFRQDGPLDMRMEQAGRSAADIVNEASEEELADIFYYYGEERMARRIARAIVARPSLLLADEAVSALDLSTRIQIVELFKRLSAEMTLVFVSHDIAVVAALCDELVVLQAGRVVEAGPTRGILSQPQHPYTKSLLASVPRMPAR